MAVKKETIEGTKIINEIESSNLVKTEYDVESKKLIAEFKNGAKYEYDEVPHNIYTKFRMAESQGKFFNTEISKTYKYKRVWYLYLMDKSTSILKSFSVRKELNPKIWVNPKSPDTEMNPNIRESLLEIAYQFIDSLKVDVFIEDIVITGSLCNYNWSEYSDVDLHLMVDYSQFPEEQVDIYKELFNIKKILFNKNHDITIKNYDVEVYCQESTEAHFSSGIYSVLFNEWNEKPKKESVKIDKAAIKNKASEWMRTIDNVIKNVSDEDLEEAKEILGKYKEKLKKYRTSGLEKNGEYSNENLVFKFLRRNGYIEKLYDFENKLMDKSLSLSEYHITNE